VGTPLQIHVIAPGYSYQHHPDHRNGTPAKSQWIITEAQERDAFDGARTRNWLKVRLGWGLHAPNAHASYLGISPNGQEVFVAKFVASNPPVVWHGYPADHQRNPHDVPELQILRDWENSQLITPSQMRKLLRGQPCDL